MRNRFAIAAGSLLISMAVALPALAQYSSPTQPNQPNQVQPSQQNQTSPTHPSQPNQPTQMNQGTGVPNVSNLKPFSAETNYMSLAGYLRYVSYGQTGQWLTRAEATRMVTQQKGQ